MKHSKLQHTPTSNKGGRPSTKEEAENRQKCEEAFNHRWPQRYAAIKTKLDIKTVNKYYQMFRDDLVSKLDNDFLREQRTHREMAMEALQFKIDEAREHMSWIKGNMGEDSVPYGVASSHIIKLLEDISNYEQQLHALGMSPTLDVRIAAKVLGNVKSEPGSTGTS